MRLGLRLWHMFVGHGPFLSDGPLVEVCVCGKRFSR